MNIESITSNLFIHMCYVYFKYKKSYIAAIMHILHSCFWFLGTSWCSTFLEEAIMKIDKNFLYHIWNKDKEILEYYYWLLVITDHCISYTYSLDLPKIIILHGHFVNTKLLCKIPLFTFKSFIFNRLNFWYG